MYVQAGRKRLRLDPVWRRIGAVMMAIVLTITGVSIQSKADNGGALGASWNVSVTIKDGNTLEEKNTFQPGDTLTLALNFRLNLGHSGEWSSDLFADPLVFYIHKGAIPEGLKSMTNPPIPKNNDSDTNYSTFLPFTEPVVEGDYYKYTLRFDVDNIEAAATENRQLINVLVEASALLSSEIVSDTYFDLIKVEEGGSFTYNYGASVTPPDTPDPGEEKEEGGISSLTKRVRFAMRQSTGSGTYDTLLKDSTSDSSQGFREGDLVIFQITVAPKSGNVGYLYKLTDLLGAGFTPVLPGQTINTNVTIVSNPSAFPRLNTGGMDLKVEEIFTTYTWKADPAVATNAYSMTFPPAKITSSAYYYLVTKVNSNFKTGAGDAEKASRTNNAYVYGYSGGGAGPGPGDGIGGVVVVPVEEGPIYDMALEVKLTDVFASNKAKLHSSEQNSRSVPQDGYIRSQIRLTNQGNRPTTNTVVRLYVPKGLQVVTDADELNALGYTGTIPWTKVDSVDKTDWDSTVLWSGLTVYEAPYDKVIAGSNSTTGHILPMFYKVMGPGEDYNATNMRDYYIAAEIVEFTAQDGAKITATSDTQDLDSQPDANPTNDLNGTQIWSGTKEVSSRISKAGYTGTGALRQQATEDEDDFDFVWVSAILGMGGNWTHGDMLSKNAITDTNTAKTIFDKAKGKLPNSTSYSPLGSNKVAPNYYTYVVYQIDVNYDGLALLHQNYAGKLVDTIPEGINILSYQESGTTYYGVYMERIKGNPKATLADGRTIIDRTNPDFYTTTTLYFAGSNIQSSYRTGSVASNYGVYADYNNTDRKLTINFGEATQKEDKYQDDGTAYRLYIVAVMDDIQMTDERLEIENKVALTYEEQKEELVRRDTIVYSYNAGTAAIGKFVVDGGKEIVDGYHIATPTGDTNSLQVQYRIKLPTNINFPAGEVKFSDRTSSSYYDGIVGGISGVTVSRVEGGAPTMSVTETTRGFDAVNHVAMPAKVSNHVFDFAFQYDEVPYGAVLKNTAIVPAYSVVPLKLRLQKQDAEDGRALTGYQLKAYYAKPDMTHDPAAEVLDVKGNPIVFTDTATVFDLIPRHYTPQMTNQTWNIVLVEETTPAGYEKNTGAAFALTVTSDSAGNLSVSSVDDLSYTVQGGKYGDTAITVRNAKDVAKLRIRKVDDEGNALGSPTGAPIAFAITKQPDGAAATKTIDANGSSEEFVLTAGTYRLEELESTVPTGFDRSERAAGTLVVYRDAAANELKIRLEDSKNLAVTEDNGVFVFTAENKRMDGLYLVKLDKSDNDRRMTDPIVFDVQRKQNGVYEDYTTLTVGPNGATNAIQLAAGQYKVAERVGTMPAGYNRSLYAYGEITVRMQDGKAVMERTAGTPSQNFALLRDESGAYYIEAANERSQVSVSLIKEDDKGAAVTAAIRFNVARVDGTGSFLLTVGADGKTGSMPLRLGAYTVTEDTATIPDGYVKESYAHGTILVRAADNGGLELALDQTKDNQNLTLEGDSRNGYVLRAVNALVPTEETTTEESTTEEKTTEERTTSGGGSTTPDTPPTNPTQDPTAPTTPNPPSANTDYGEVRDSGGRNTPDTEFVPIGDQPVPLANLPLTDIFDDGVPLAALPQTGTTGGMTIAVVAFAISALGLAVLLPKKKK